MDIIKPNKVSEIDHNPVRPSRNFMVPGRLLSVRSGQCRWKLQKTGDSGNIEKIQVHIKLIAFWK